MKIEIENVKLERATHVAWWRDAWIAVGKLEVGQSFFIELSTNSISGTLSAVGLAMGRKFSTKKEARGMRVGRIA